MRVCAFKFGDQRSSLIQISKKIPVKTALALRLRQKLSVEHIDHFKTSEKNAEYKNELQYEYGSEAPAHIRITDQESTVSL